jgi:hypothetical protein
MASLTVGVLAPVALLTGCGGGGGNGLVQTQNSVFAGTYNGTVAGDATGTISFNVTNTGTITNAQLNLTTPVQANAVSTRAVYSAASSVLHSDGSFEINFTVGGQTYTFRGVLTQLGGSVVGAQLTWSSTGGLDGTYDLQVTVGNPNGPGGPGTGCGAGQVDATFNASGSTSAITSLLSTDCGNGALVASGGRTISATASFATPSGNEVRSISVVVTDAINGVGARTYPIDGSSATVLYAETTAGTGRTEQWSGTGGNLIVESFANNRIQFRIEDAAMVPATTPPNQTTIVPGTGNFNITGSGNLTIQ